MCIIGLLTLGKFSFVPKYKANISDAQLHSLRVRSVYIDLHAFRRVQSPQF